MMAQHEKFARLVTLLAAQFEGELTAEQRSELDALLDTPELRQVASGWSAGLSAAAESYQKYSARKAFEKFSRRVQRAKAVSSLGSARGTASPSPKLTTRAVGWSTAAAAAVVIGVCALLTMRGGDAQPETTLAAATERAMFFAADGQVVELTGADTTINQAVISGGTIFLTNPENSLSEGAPSQATTAARNRVVVPRGGIFSVRLADGTLVTLNAGSELSFPAAFEGGERRVALRGEGYFEVAHDARRPFIVTMHDGVDVRVLGTRFNIQSYCDDPQTQVTLLQGKVAVSHGEDDIVLRNSWQAVFDHNSGALTAHRATNAAGAMAWAQGVFDFDAAPLSVVLRSLERWYDVDFDLSGVDVDGLGLFSMRVNCTADLQRILDMLHETTGLSYQLHGRDVTLVDN